MHFIKCPGPLPCHYHLLGTPPSTLYRLRLATDKPTRMDTQEARRHRPYRRAAPQRAAGPRATP